MSDTSNITPKELAAELFRDEKAIRAYLRKIVSETPGSGGRYAISADCAEAVRVHFSGLGSRRTVVTTLKIKA